MVVPKSHAYLPLPGPACPSPPPFSCLCSLSGPEIHAPNPRPLGTPTTNLGDRGMTQTPDRGGGTGAHALVLSLAPRDAGTCREEELPRLPAHGLGETKNLVPSASSSPSQAGVRASRSTCWRRAHLQLRSPAALLRVAWGGAGWQRLGGSERLSGEGRGLRALAPGTRPAPLPRAGDILAHARDPDPGGGASAPVWGWGVGVRCKEGRLLCGCA